jgi:hypothetical protein
VKLKKIKTAKFKWFLRFSIAGIQLEFNNSSLNMVEVE